MTAARGCEAEAGATHLLLDALHPSGYDKPRPVVVVIKHLLPDLAAVGGLRPPAVWPASIWFPPVAANPPCKEQGVLPRQALTLDEGQWVQRAVPQPKPLDEVGLHQGGDDDVLR